MAWTIGVIGWGEESIYKLGSATERWRLYQDVAARI